MNGSDQKFYNTGWFGILMLILFFPVGLYLIWKNNYFKKGTKIIITLIFFAPIGFYFLWKDDYFSKNTKIILTVVFSFIIVFAILTESDEHEESEQKNETGTAENIDESSDSKVENEEEKFQETAGDKEELNEVDLEIEIEVTETEITDDIIKISGTTNLIDGAYLGYQIKATEDNVRVQNGVWEITENIQKIEDDDEYDIYSNGDEYKFYITYPPFGDDDLQSEDVLAAYGGAGATKITGGPEFYESEDGSFKTVSIGLNFDKEGIIDPEEREQQRFDKAVDNWDEYKVELLDHYGEFGVVDLRPLDGYDDGYSSFYVYVLNEYKALTDNEKQYYVEEIGPLIVSDLNAHFGRDAKVEFNYEDGNTMASRKIFGGWKIK